MERNTIRFYNLLPYLWVLLRGRVFQDGWLQYFKYGEQHHWVREKQPGAQEQLDSRRESAMTLNVERYDILRALAERQVPKDAETSINKTDERHREHENPRKVRFILHRLLERQYHADSREAVARDAEKERDTGQCAQPVELRRPCTGQVNQREIGHVHDRETGKVHRIGRERHPRELFDVLEQGQHDEKRQARQHHGFLRDAKVRVRIRGNEDQVYTRAQPAERQYDGMPWSCSFGAHSRALASDSEACLRDDERRIHEHLAACAQRKVPDLAVTCDVHAAVLEFVLALNHQEHAERTDHAHENQQHETIATVMEEKKTYDDPRLLEREGKTEHPRAEERDDRSRKRLRPHNSHKAVRDDFNAQTRKHANKQTRRRKAPRTMRGAAALLHRSPAAHARHTAAAVAVASASPAAATAAPSLGRRSGAESP
ncbi:hypothetical protein FI667_g10964, partial [Globisporangium splendens]